MYVNILKWLRTEYFHSFVAQCEWISANGRRSWVGFNTDACLRPNCGNTGKAVLIGRDEFLKDAEETVELRSVAADNLLRSFLHEGLQQTDQRRNIPRTIPQN